MRTVWSKGSTASPLTSRGVARFLSALLTHCRLEETPEPVQPAPGGRGPGARHCATPPSHRSTVRLQGLRMRGSDGSNVANSTSRHNRRKHSAGDGIGTRSMAKASPLYRASAEQQSWHVSYTNRMLLGAHLCTALSGISVSKARSRFRTYTPPSSEGAHQHYSTFL